MKITLNIRRVTVTVEVKRNRTEEPLTLEAAIERHLHKNHNLLSNLEVHQALETHGYRDEAEIENTLAEMAAKGNIRIYEGRGGFLGVKWIGE